MLNNCSNITQPLPESPWVRSVRWEQQVNNQTGGIKVKHSELLRSLPGSLSCRRTFQDRPRRASESETCCQGSDGTNQKNRCRCKKVMLLMNIKKEKNHSHRLTLRMGHMHLRFRHRRLLASGLCSPFLQLAHCPQFTELRHPTHWPQGIHYQFHKQKQTHCLFLREYLSACRVL